MPVANMIFVDFFLNKKLTHLEGHLNYQSNCEKFKDDPFYFRVLRLKLG